MNLEAFLISILALVVLALGFCILISGKWTFYPKEDDSSVTIVLSGGKARFIGFLLVVSSFFLFAGNYYGFAGLVLAALLPRILSSSSDS